jgi:hypothetical protein
MKKVVSSHTRDEPGGLARQIQKAISEALLEGKGMMHSLGALAVMGDWL